MDTRKSVYRPWNATLIKRLSKNRDEDVGVQDTVSQTMDFPSLL